MAWDLPESSSISWEEAAVFASLARLVGATLAVETGTNYGIGTRRLRTMLPAATRLISIDTEPGVTEVPGAEVIVADSATWTPPEPIGALFLDCAPGRTGAWENLRRHMMPGGIVVLHDANFGAIPDVGGFLSGRIQVGVA